MKQGELFAAKINWYLREHSLATDDREMTINLGQFVEIWPPSCGSIMCASGLTANVAQKVSGDYPPRGNIIFPGQPSPHNGWRPSQWDELPPVQTGDGILHSGQVLNSL
jgi:hypothetical protein